MKGKIKWYSAKKGYGFISGDDDNEYFVHHTQLVTNNEFKFNIGDNVKFDPIETNKGLQAKSVIKCA